MKIISNQAIILLIIVLLSMISCKKELLTPACNGSTPTYDADIKMIIDTKCMGSSCHDSGAKRGDFTTYTGLEHYLNDGKFDKRVLVKQNMPKGRDNSLTQEEINMIQCWVDNNYPEN